MNVMILGVSRRLGGWASRAKEGEGASGSATPWQRIAPVILLALACASQPVSPPGAIDSDAFSEAAVDAHLANLHRLGAREAGSDGDDAARAYLGKAFAQDGIPLRVIEDGTYRHLLGLIPGQSRDRVLLIAPYAALGANDWVDDAGAAFLLELGRVLVRRGPQPYTIQLALAETRQELGFDRAREALAGEPPGPDAAALSSLEARERVALAGASLARALARETHHGPVRAVIAFEPRAGVKPRMARDLRSHPVFRAIFWEVADQLGHGDSFPAEGGWRSPVGLQAAFRSEGHAQILALVDETTARAELQAHLGQVAAGDPALAAGLGSVGSVTVEALARLMERFSRIDAFAP